MGFARGLEGDGGAGEPGGFELEAGGGAAGGVDGAGEGGLAVALERHAGDGLGDEDVVGGIEGFDGDGHRLFVGVEEGVDVDRYGGAHGGCGVVGLREAQVVGGQAGGGVEAFAAAAVGGADLGGLGRTSVGGDQDHFGVDAVERGGEVELGGAGDGDGLRVAEHLAGALAGEHCRRGAGEVEDVAVVVGVAQGHHCVVAHGQVAVELTEGGVGGGVALELGDLAHLGAVGGVEGQGHRADTGIVGGVFGGLGGDLPLADGEVAEGDVDLGGAGHGAGLAVFAAGGEEEGDGSDGEEGEGGFHGDKV